MDKELLKKYFEGKCNANERAEVAKHLNEQENLDENLDDIFDAMWEGGKDFSKDEIFSGMLYNEIESKISDTIQHQDKSKSGRIVFASILKYAAMLVIASSILFFLYQNLPTQQETVMQHADVVTKSTSRGQKSTIQLSDGSKVILNSGSQISYTKYFTDSTRTIELVGEAYFDVAKDVTRPFSVISNGIRTTALGTSFNVNGRNGNVKVSLATGKIVVKNDAEVQTEQKLHFLNPGDAISFDKESKKVERSVFDYKKDFLWKDGIIYFDDASFTDIEQKLSAWYDVQFEIKNGQVPLKKYTGQFDNETLRNVLESMGFALGFDYFLNGKKVRIIFNTQENTN